MIVSRDDASSLTGFAILNFKLEGSIFTESADLNQNDTNGYKGKQKLFTKVELGHT